MYGLIENKNKNIFLFAGLISILFSAWMSIREYVVNPDAICYLLSAEKMQAGLHAAMHLCPQAQWPFYSALIYAFAKISTLSYTSSASVLDGLFSLISVLAFISIIRFITNNTRILWIAAFVILFSHEFNAVRQYIVRDHGFWAFYLLSMFFLLRYFRDHQWRKAWIWSISLIVATLFRVEGSVFLLLMPFAVLLDNRYSVGMRLKHFVQLNSIAILGMAALAIVVLTQPQIELTRLNEVQFQLLHGFSAAIQHFTDLKAAFVQHIIGPDSAKDAGSILLLMMVCWYLLSAVFNLSLVYSGLVIYAWYKRLLHAEYPVRLVLWGYVLVNVIITAGFLIEHMFLSKRYLIALSLSLMIWVPFALDNLLQQWKARKWPFLLAIILMVASVTSGILDFGYSKKYIYDAGQWVSKNTPPQASVYSNDYQVMYYTNHFGDALFDKARDYMDINTIANDKWKQFDFLVIRVNKKDAANKIIDQITYPIVQVMANKRGDQVRIYQRKEP